MSWVELILRSYGLVLTKTLRLKHIIFLLLYEALLFLIVFFLYLEITDWASVSLQTHDNWHKYERSEIRIKVWAEIQLHVFTLVRVNEYLESTCHTGSDQDLHYWVSAVFYSSLDHAHCIKVYWTEHLLWSLSKWTQKDEICNASHEEC